MSGKALDRIRKHSKRIVTSGGFEESITLKSANGSQVLQLTGLVSKHWINFDTDGNAANSKNAHITIDEDLLKAANYTYRNTDGEVDLRKHKVTAPDSTGLDKEYVIIEWFPDETLGLIACILGDYELNQ